MWAWLTDISYTAHGYCLSWDPWLIALHAGADFLTFGSYVAIPVAILMFMRRRPKLELKRLAWFFTFFVFLCGLTHLMALVTLWYPLYDIQGVLKAATAVVSVATAVLIFFLLPTALAIPSPTELKIANEKLTAEIASHQKTLTELRVTQTELEDRVRDRTRDLGASAAHAKILVKEIAHRSGNLMSVVAAMARLSYRSAQTPQQFVHDFVDRIQAMGRSQDLLLHNDWRPVDLEAVMRDQLRPFLSGGAINFSGPKLSIGANAAHNIGMAFYELATNSAKYGALSVSEGRVSVSWDIDANAGGEGTLAIRWQERNGPPYKAPRRKGWGTTVLTSLVSTAVGGTADIDAGTDGFVWRLRAPLPSLMS